MTAILKIKQAKCTTCIVAVALIYVLISCSNYDKKSSTTNSTISNHIPVDSLYNVIPTDSLPLISFERFRCASKYKDFESVKAICTPGGLKKLNTIFGDLSLKENQENFMQSIAEEFKEISIYSIKKDRFIIYSPSYTFVYSDGARLTNGWSSLTFVFEDSNWRLSGYNRSL